MSTAESETSLDVRELCRRVLGDGPVAEEAAEARLAEGAAAADRIEALSAAISECRRRSDDGPAAPAGLAPEPAPPAQGVSLAEAVTAELRHANVALPARQREALALRELLRLSHAQLAEVMGLDTAAVALLLSRARLQLRTELRGGAPGATEGCAERDRALRVLARRQDSEPVDEDDDEWIRRHMAACPGCEQAHAAMLEASVRYRGWSRST